jgi:hypothetical protein
MSIKEQETRQVEIEKAARKCKKSLHNFFVLSKAHSAPHFLPFEPVNRKISITSLSRQPSPTTRELVHFRHSMLLSMQNAAKFQMELNTFRVKNC